LKLVLKGLQFEPEEKLWGRNLLRSLVWKAGADGNGGEIVVFNGGVDNCEGNNL
jgi:hypothetical protein